MSVEDELQRNLNVLRNILCDTSLARDPDGDGTTAGGGYDVPFTNQISDDTMGVGDPLLKTCNIPADSSSSLATPVSENRSVLNTPDYGMSAGSPAGLTDTGGLLVEDSQLDEALSSDQLIDPPDHDPLAETDPLVLITNGNPGMITGDGGNPGLIAGDDGNPGLITGDDGSPGLITGDDGSPGLITGDDGSPGLITGDIVSDHVMDAVQSNGAFTAGCRPASHSVADKKLSGNSENLSPGNSVSNSSQNARNSDLIVPSIIGIPGCLSSSVVDKDHLKVDSGICESSVLCESSGGSVDSVKLRSSGASDSNRSSCDSNDSVLLVSSECSTDTLVNKKSVTDSVVGNTHQPPAIDANILTVGRASGREVSAVTSEVDPLRHKSTDDEVQPAKDDNKHSTSPVESASSSQERQTGLRAVENTCAVSRLAGSSCTPIGPELIVLDGDEPNSVSHADVPPQTSSKHSENTDHSPPTSSSPPDAATGSSRSVGDLSGRPRKRRRTASSALNRIRISAGTGTVSSLPRARDGSDASDDDVVILDSATPSVNDNQLELNTKRMVEEASSLRVTVDMRLNNSYCNTAVSPEVWRTMCRDRADNRRAHWRRVRQTRCAPAASSLRPVGPSPRARTPITANFSQRRLAGLKIISATKVAVKPSAAAQPAASVSSESGRVVSGYVHAPQCPYSCYVHMLIDNQCAAASLPARPRTCGLCWSTVRQCDLEPECVIHEERESGPRAALHRDDSLMCHRCGHQFCGVVQLHRHLVVTHGDLGVGVQFQCALCELWFDSVSAFRTHVHQQHGPPVFGDYRCSLCRRNWGRSTSVSDEWFLHFLTMHVRNKRMAAGNVAAASASARSGAPGFVSEAGGFHSCPLCKRWTGRLQSMRSHLLTAHRGASMVTAQVVRSPAPGVSINTKQISVMHKCALCSHIATTDSEWCTHVLGHAVLRETMTGSTVEVTGVKRPAAANSQTVSNTMNVAKQSMVYARKRSRGGNVCPRCNMQFAKVIDFSLHWKQVHLDTTSVAGPASNLVRKPLKVATTQPTPNLNRKVSSFLPEHRCYRCGVQCASEPDLAQHFVAEHTRLRLSASSPTITAPTTNILQSLTQSPLENVMKAKPAAGFPPCEVDGEESVLRDASISLLLDCVLD